MRFFLLPPSCSIGEAFSFFKKRREEGCLLSVRKEEEEEEPSPLFLPRERRRRRRGRKRERYIAPPISAKPPPPSPPRPPLVTQHVCHVFPPLLPTDGSTIKGKRETEKEEEITKAPTFSSISQRLRGRRRRRQGARFHQ